MHERLTQLSCVCVCVCHAWHLSTSLYASYIHDTIIFIIWLFSYRILFFIADLFYDFSRVFGDYDFRNEYKRRRKKKYERKTDDNDDDTKWTHTLKQLKNLSTATKREENNSTKYNLRCRIRMTSVHRIKIIPICCFFALFMIKYCHYM